MSNQNSDKGLLHLFHQSTSSHNSIFTAVLLELWSGFFVLGHSSFLIYVSSFEEIFEKNTFSNQIEFLAVVTCHVLSAVSCTDQKLIEILNVSLRTVSATGSFS